MKNCRDLATHSLKALGYAAAHIARETLENAAIIGRSEVLGGLCILRGCMPSKALIYSAEVLHLARNAEKTSDDVLDLDFIPAIG